MIFDNIPSIHTLKTEIEMFTFVSTFNVYKDHFFHKKIVLHGRDIHGYISESQGNFSINIMSQIIDHNEFVEETWRRIEGKK